MRTWREGGGEEKVGMEENGEGLRSQRLQTSPLTLPPQWKRKCQSRERTVGIVGAAGMCRRQGTPGGSEKEA